LTQPDNGPSTNARRRRAGVIGAVVGVAAAGLAAGVAAERLIIRRTRMSHTDLGSEPFGRLPFDESLTVSTADGIDLYVEIVEPTDGVEMTVGFTPPGVMLGQEPTLVFVHGFCLDMGTFHFQRRELSRAGNYRMVFYDQPGHGRSGRLDHGEYTLAMLAQGLKDVLDATVTTGPIVLIGHSMGGMSIMALAEAHPELFGTLVQGVVFISTSAGKLDDLTFGMPAVLARFSRQLLPLVTHTGRATGGVIDAARRASTDLAWLLTRKYGFGTKKPNSALVSYVERMNGRTTTEVVARYLRALYSHAGYSALNALSEVKVLAICGDQDALTPLTHSEELVAVLPKARLVVVPDAGHVALMERPDIVNEALESFLEEIN
jgi:pimeloyl-ACP methyl ester carboxylesterase